MKKPLCIIVTGRPGSGKTTLAKKLGEHMYLPVFCRDELKEGYVNTYRKKHSQLPDDTNAIVTNIFFDTLVSLLEKNISLIAEAAFQHKVWSTFLERIEQKTDIRIVLCSVPDVIAAKRHLERGLEDKRREFYHGDTRVTHFRKTGELLDPGPYEAPHLPLPTFTVVTQSERYSPSLEELSQALRDNI
jgi:adenylate kinase family enzyme